MVEFRRKQIDDTGKIPVVIENIDGTETKKILEYRCPLKDYTFTHKVMGLAEELQEAEKVDPATLETLDTVCNKTKELFELMAPGKWDEFFELVSGNLEDISLLVQGMAENAISKGIAAKQAEIAPVIPEDAVEV